MNLKKKSPDPLKPKFPKVSLDIKRRVIHCFTDGACEGNGKAENRGGWAFVIVENGQPVYEGKGPMVNTTNNKCELQGLIECLECLDENYPSNMQILVHSDSQYCVHGIQTWYKGWIAKGWKDIKNPDEWKYLIELRDRFTDIQFKWVRAHQELTGYSKLRDFETKWNNYVDELAVEACTGKREEDSIFPIDQIKKRRDDLIAEMQVVPVHGDFHYDSAGKLKVYDGYKWIEYNPPRTLEEVTKDLVEAQELLSRVYRDATFGTAAYEAELYDDLHNYLKSKGKI